jgi:hypothetical protein
MKIEQKHVKVLEENTTMTRCVPFEQQFFDFEEEYKCTNK